MNEESYGIIPCREGEFFLVQHQAGHWGFPKGHAESGESPEETARRELFEETNLKVVRLLTPTPLVEQYTFLRYGKRIEKQVTYFLAQVEGEVALQGDEIAQGRWVSFEEAAELITFPEGKELCQRAIKGVEL